MSRSLSLGVHGLGLWGPGWADAEALRTWLQTPTASLSTATHSLPPATCLAPADRRRVPPTVRLALAVAAQAAAGQSDLPAVFLSVYGDMANTDVILHTLAESPREISPTRFTHSVHNAAAGYWSMASGSHAGMYALGTDRHGFAAGLLTAALQAQAEGNTLFVAYETASSGPQAEIAQVPVDLGCALRLGTEQEAVPRLHLQILQGQGQTTLPVDQRLHSLCQQHPAGRALALFEALLTTTGHQSFTWPLGSGTLLHIELEKPSL